MLEQNQKRAAEYETSLLERPLEVLLEKVEIDGKNYLGHSREYVKGRCRKRKYGVNDILAVKVEKDHIFCRRRKQFCRRDQQH